MPWSKRIFDFIFALIALIIFSPVLIVTAILVRVFIGAPILFTQQRPGYKGRPFNIYKFRSMTNRIARDGSLLPDAERLTRFGRILRSLSLDELPELFNILRGEMSFVGPRPLLMEYLPLYSPEQMRRHDAMPGLTGWAQVNGRNALDWPSRFRLDVWYVDHWSFWLDLRIILMTVGKVIAREGVNQAGQSTVEYFKGEQ
ncbi:MAG TPA: sugar transferase [Anaerolineales bacterium]|nr:sugar transferase [Anaerolineales bacterium]HMV97296.1 sugar transferase [Anaerolineales bacterium]HMX75237.1 sugar transferase [Anaerolineales bacterium]HMZ44166.1 sugar transferase [Anaerolineales bacterium]HNA55431.1 sugar transferase [Anaerolineales bacterium]